MNYLVVLWGYRFCYGTENTRSTFIGIADIRHPAPGSSRLRLRVDSERRNRAIKMV